MIHFSRTVRNTAAEEDTEQVLCRDDSHGCRPDTASIHDRLCGGGVRHQNPVLCIVAAPRRRWAVFRDGVWVQKAKFLNPAVFWHHTHLSLCLCLCLCSSIQRSMTVEEEEPRSSAGT